MDKYNACIYARLSKEDKEKKESESITNQIQLIKNYISNTNDINIKMTKIDDGYSGSNFNRPAFKEMIEEIKKGTINCIIVKDFSRFGRNFIDTSKYIEKIFPMLKVRFIAINDNYDSIKENEENGLIVPFKNLINDAYVKDISVKIKSQKNMKMKNGEFIGSFTTYGYLKDPCNKGKLIIDEEATKVIKEIFKLKIDGYSSKKIADKLNEQGILSPMEHKKSMGLNFTTSFKKNEKAKWDANAINRILKNEIYIGTLVQGKTTNINHKMKLSLKKDKKDWYIIENNHPCIIEKETFECVQSLLLKDTRIAPNQDKVYKFSGLIYCGDCGRSMIRKNCGTKEKPNYYFICSGYKNGNGCTSHITKCEDIDNIILTYLRHHIDLFVNVDEIIKIIDEVLNRKSEVEYIENSILSKEKEIETYKNYKFKIYNDYQEELISKSEFLEYSKKYEENIQNLYKIIENLKQEIQDILSGNLKRGEWLERFKECRNIPYLNRALLVNVLNKIEIYDDKLIQIYYKFIDEFKANIELIKDFLENNEEMKPLLENIMNG
ncbi:MAG: recombinase family protein [Lachnospirales bacterium]